MCSSDLPVESLPLSRDRWTTVYLEHGRLEVDDSSVKWISSEGWVCRLPIATISCLMLGPGTTLTHAAVKTCAECRTPLVWCGEDGIRFYAHGLSLASHCDMARLHATVWANPKKNIELARKMFVKRFPEIDVSKYSIQELRGMEGIRVRRLYSEMGLQFGVTWKGRNYSKQHW